MTSELTVAELLAPVKLPGARTVAEKLALYETVFNAGLVKLIPVSRTILRESALLRETHPQKLADAIHVATALQAPCSYLMSSDAGLKRLPPPLQSTSPDEAGVALVLGALRG